MGKYRILSMDPLKRQKTLGNIGVFDIETNRWADQKDLVGLTEEQIKTRWHDAPIIPFLLCYHDAEKDLTFEGPDCCEQFLRQHLTHKNRGKTIFSHNGGKFDLIALYQSLVRDKRLSQKFFARPIMQGSRILILIINSMDKKNNWTFRDSFALLPSSLDYLSKSFKITHPKLPMPTKPYDEAKKEWATYCLTDCYALYDVLKDFNDIIIDIGGCVKSTIASTALATFRLKFQNMPFYTYFEYNEVFRNAYYGGRSEVITLLAPERNGPYYYYDVNSMYPSVMADNIFPISRPQSVRYTNLEQCTGKCGIMECDVYAPEDLLDIPILPYHSEEMKKLIFPLGRWSGFYEFSLIEKAIKYGYEITPHRIWEFEGEPVFHDFVNTLYDIRMKSEGAKQYIMKNLLNSAYGKYAERPERHELITDPNADITGLSMVDETFGYMLRTYVRNSPHHLPAISIRVTALAQLKLYSLIEQIQHLGGTIYYMDTDSIMTNVRLPTSMILGDIKLEYDWKRGVFLSQKSYIIDPFEGPPKVVMKGFTELKKKMNTYEQWEELLLTEDFSKCFEHTVRPASLNEIRIRGLSGFVTLHQKRQLASIADKRLINPDFSTRPIILNEW